MDNEKIIQDFINLFNNMKDGPEKDIFALCGRFNKETGGKLSKFDSPTPVCVAVIQVLDENNEVKFLGVRRAIMPKIHEVAFPGGFSDKLENCPTTAARETMEEAGLAISADDFVLLDSQMSPTNNLLIFMLCTKVFDKSIMDTLVLNSEVEEFVLIDANTPMAFPLHSLVRDNLYKEINGCGNDCGSCSCH